MRSILAVLLILAVVARAEDKLEDALSALRAAPADGREAAVQAVLSLKPDRAAVLTALRKPLVAPATQAGWRLLKATDEKGVTRPFEIYIPESLVGTSEPVPLLVHMHGGVSRPAYPALPGQQSSGARWVASADEHGFVIVAPAARADCVWWTAPGAAHVRAVIREAKRLGPIDDNAIVGTGFSDGGSGAYYLAMAEPEPFAAFIPMNGHPSVASGASREQLYLANMVRTPLFVTMTQDDQLYPAASVLPHMRVALAAGVPIHLVSYPRGGHRPVYFDEQRGALVRFLTDTPRDPSPRELQWRCATPRLGRVSWMAIEEIGPSDSDGAAEEDLNVTSTPGRVRIGVGVDREFDGGGVRITTVSKDSLAAKIALQAGDVIVEMDGKKIGGLGDLSALLRKKRLGDQASITVRRGEETLEKKGQFPPFVPRPVYLRKAPTASLALTSEGNRIIVRSRNVRGFRLSLPADLFGDGAVALAVNGKRIQPEMREIPLEEILGRYAREADSGRVYGREAIVKVP